MDREITPRPYRPEDLTGAVAIWRESERAAFPYVEVQQLYTLEDDTGFFRDVIAQECDVWLAESEGKIQSLLVLRENLINRLCLSAQC